MVLGQLQEEPENGSLWEELTGIVTAATESKTDLERILGQARARYAERREWLYAAKLLELEVEMGEGPFLATQLAELGRIYDEELCDSIKATEMYERTLEIEGAPDAAVEKASQFLEAEESKRAKWSELCDRYLAEAATATDDSFKSVLFASAADVAHRYGQEAISREALVEYIETALKLDPKNRRATLLAEVVYAKAGDFEGVARVLSRMLVVGASREDRVAAGLKAARIYSRVLGRKEEAIDAYQQVLDMAPGQPDALAYLAEAFEETEQWDHLVALYEDQLKSGLKGDAELGMLLQLGMVHWRRRDRPDAAEPYFDRIRRSDPTHAGMLAFFRDACAKKGDTNRLVSILTDAQRATQDPAAKRELGTEIAKLAEQGDNAGKAIEQYRQLAKADPNNVEAREALKRLYTQTANFAALAELLRQDLDRLPAEDTAGRASVLREIATLYRDKQKNEQALVATLVQLTNVEPNDTAALRELIEIYEHLGRFRDLLICQQKLAEISPDPAEKAELYRASARRWADQFSNVQNAIAAYEGLLAAAPSDEEARSKLRELYAKRRAWPQLFSLMELEAKDAEGAAKVELLNEMAKLAAERLDRGADAIAIQKQILELDPSNANVFDALEKQAEREKDYATLAEVLEKRVEATADEPGKLALLQKLGGVYETRIKDPALTARTWKRVLDLSPGHQKALRVLRESYLAAGDFDALEALYEGQGDYENLADFLSTAADKAAPAQKVAISFRAARVYEDKLHAKERASRSYERVLTVEPTNAQAAAALVPTYEKDERWARLPALYEVLLSVAESDAARVELLRKLASVAGGPLADKAGALGFARRAYEITPDADQLELLESWSRAASSWGPFVEAVEARLKKRDDLDPALERALKLKLADAYARELGKIDEAVTTYREIVSADPHDADVIQAFDTLLRGAERQADLRWLYGVRVEAAEPARRAEIYEEWATLEEDVFGNAKDAIELYKKATELEPTRGDALRALSRLLLAAGDFKTAAKVIAQHRDSAEGEARAQREIELAELYISELNEPVLAFEACVRALELRPRDPDAVTILSRLLDFPVADAASQAASEGPDGLKSPDTVRAKAARVLEDEYRELGDARRESQVLAIVMESEGNPERRLALHQKLADVEDKQLSAPGTAFATVLRALNEFPDEIALWDRAASLGMRAGRPTDLAESYRAHIVTVDPEAARRLSRETELLLCERAAALHDDQLGDADGAMPYLKRILQMDPTNDKAFERLKQILTGSERWSELEELFEQAALNSTDIDRKIGILGEVAMVAEEIMGDPTKAIRYHERILAIDPLHVPSLDTLEKLYEDEERYLDLGRLLERRLETSVDDEAVDIRLYLGRLYLERLEQPEASLTKCEEILHARPDDPEARELAERLLELEPLRLRAAVLLEGVYEARDDAKSLVRMLEIRLERCRDQAEKRDLLRRISEIRDERLNDHAGAFAAYADRLPMDPEDEPTRTRFIELGKTLGLYSKVAEVLGTAADATTAKPVRASILMSVAELYEGPLDDVARAQAEYAKVIDTDPNDPAIVIPAARALTQIHASKGNHAALAETLSIEVKLEESIDKRKELYERLGVLYETELNEPGKAVEAYRARLSDDPGDLEALGALERLYASKGDFRELVRVLRAREEATTDEAERRRAMIKVAETLSSLSEAPAGAGAPVADATEAINAWRAVLDTFGPERSTLAALARLYERSERYADLAETLEVDLSLADDPKDRIDLLGRLGDVRRRHLHDLPGALDAYRQALELDTGDARSRAALESMLADGDDSPASGTPRPPNETQKLAAEILHPLYEAEGENEKLLRVLEVEASAADAPAEKLDKIAKALATAEGPLDDKARAYGYATRAVREAASEDSIGEHVETLERLTEATGKYADTLALYRSVVGDLMNGEAQQTMLLRIGELATEKAKDRKLAIEFYKRALEARTDDKRALVALEKLYEERDLDPDTGPTSRDPQALLEILRRRAEIAESDEERRELLFRQADLQETSLEDGAGAVTTLEAVLDIPAPDGGLDPRATSKLETLYTVQKRFKDLVGLYERRLDVISGDGSAPQKAELRVKIAKIQRAHLDDTAGAFDELRAALDADADNAGALAELESVLDDAEATP
ncbi:MAG: tetratricopeptide repeat protein [Polyangiaceae bacterium]